MKRWFAILFTAIVVAAVAAWLACDRRLGQADFRRSHGVTVSQARIGGASVDPRIVRVQAIRLSDDDGGREARIEPIQVEAWVGYANRVYDVAAIRFEYDPSNDFSSLRSTLLNDAMFGDDAWRERRRYGNEIASRFPDRLPILFRHGPGDEPTGQGFSGGDVDYLFMPGFEVTRVCGHQNIGLLAHELGHYLGLGHTFAREFGTAAEVAAFLRDGEEVRSLDGDGLVETPPDPFVRASEVQCEPLATLDVEGRVFELPRDNVMSYYASADKTLTPAQIAIARETLRLRLARPTNQGAAAPLELEAAEIIDAKQCNSSVQSMDYWGADRWSSGAQLVARCEPGGRITVVLPVERPRRARLDLFATRAPDYGRVRIDLNGEAVGEPFDGYAPIVVPSGRVALGTVELAPGSHRLSFELTGTSGISTAPLLGVDCVELTDE